MRQRPSPVEITSLTSALLMILTLLPAGLLPLSDYTLPRLRSAEARMEETYAHIIDDYTDLEAFAQLAAYAARASGNDVAFFMWLMNSLILDTPANRTANWLAVLAGPWSRVRCRLHAWFPWMRGSPAPGRFGDTGFSAQDDSNQVQHVWYSVAVAYQWGGLPADLAARYHEWNAPGLLRYLPGTGRGRGSATDLALSRQGISLGRALAEGELSPYEVPGWLREQLGPAS